MPIGKYFQKWYFCGNNQILQLSFSVFGLLNLSISFWNSGRLFFTNTSMSYVLMWVWKYLHVQRVLPALITTGTNTGSKIIWQIKEKFWNRKTQMFSCCSLELSKHATFDLLPLEQTTSNITSCGWSCHTRTVQDNLYATYPWQWWNESVLYQPLLIFTRSLSLTRDKKGRRINWVCYQIT